MPSDPVTASVGVPVKAKRPTLYGYVSREFLPEAAAGRGAFVMLHPDAGVGHSTKPGDTNFTIPGEDSPSAWRPASEPPDTSRDVAIHPPHEPFKGVEYRTGCFDGQLWWANSLSGPKEHPVTHWHELPPAPGGKRE